MAPYGGEIQNEEDAPPQFAMELDLNDLSDEMLEKARKLLGETPEVRTQSLVEFRNTISEKGDLSCRTDDEFLLRFLRARKFNITASYKLLQNYLNFKSSRPELHENVWPRKLLFVGDDDIIAAPPYKDQEGRRLVFFRTGNWVPSKNKITEILQASMLVLELGLMEQAFTVVGGVCVFDFAGLSLTHVWNITLSVAETVIDLLARSFPVRIHAIHVVNQPMLFNAIFALFKPMLDRRMQEAIHFHGSDMNSLHQHISPKNLPKRYGGVHEEVSYRLWIEYMESCPKIVSELRRLGYHIEELEQA